MNIIAEDIKKLSLDEKIAVLERFLHSPDWRMFKEILKDAENYILQKILSCQDTELLRWRSELRVIRDIQNRPKLWLQQLMATQQYEENERKQVYSSPEDANSGESFPQGNVLT